MHIIRTFWQVCFAAICFKSTFCVKLYLSVEENQKPTSPIGNLGKLINNQSKTGENRKFKTYSMESDKSGYFGQRNFIKIDKKNGDIWIQSPIDREDICEQMSKCQNDTFLEYIILTDIDVYELQIQIIDINDNFPTFQPEDKTLKIPEGIAINTEYSLPVAKDKDSPKFGIKSYTLKSIANDLHEKYFKLVINPSTNNPYLKVIGDLDRESINHFEFHLFAVDGGGNPGKCKIIVEITDINDNSPQWIGLPYRKEISECTTENKILQFLAQDKDDQQTEGGRIRFKISENSPNPEIIMRTFFITDNTLYLNNGALKSLKQNKVSLVVMATDGGGRSNETTVELEIKDCNDHHPTIQISSTSLQVNENKKSKISITTISVTDLDQGINSEFSCSLNDTNYVNLEPLYQPDRESGNGSKKKIFRLSTVPGVSFDREKMSRYVVEIVCTDSGIPTLSNSEKITIFINDENDNPPTFESPHRTFSISEDAKIGSEVGKVTAIDIDSSPNNILSYSIVGGEESKQVFSINNSGQIQLIKTLDREEVDRYEFTVLSVDSGNPSLNDTCRIRVVVLDINDNFPDIIEKHYFKIVESRGSEQKHVNIGKLNATDKDNGMNGTVTFKIKSGNSRFNGMQVFSDGKLSIYGNIDREKSESIEAIIEVIDNGIPSLTATTTVFIEVLDLNDNAPVFVFPVSNYNNHINISHDTQQGSVVGKVTAKDTDKEQNGTVIFSIIGTDLSKKVFTINNDGQIILNEKLTDKIKPDRISIEARDQGNPPLKAIKSIYIRYPKRKNDINDINGESVFDSKYPRNTQPKNKSNLNGFSNNMVIIVFFVAVILVFIGVILIFLFLYRRNPGSNRMNDNSKHLPTNRDFSVAYQKGCPKNPTSKSESMINNETLMRNENYNQVEIPKFQTNYTNLLSKSNNCFSPIDNSYQFGHTLLSDDYSAFHPKSNTPTSDKEHQEFASFNPEEVWAQQKMIAATMQSRRKNLSESSDYLYENDHKYAFIHGSNVNNFDVNHELNNINHFTTPSQNRRTDFIQTRPDIHQKVKVSLVNSSFV